MLYPFKTFKKALSTAIVASLFLVGCGSADSSQNANGTNTAESAVMQERVQVGTDLEISQLKAISAAYYEKEGVVIEWLPISADLFKLDEEKELQLSQDINLPKEIDMLLMHSAYTLANASHAHKLQPIGSDILAEKIPSHYQDPKGHWFGLTSYGRTLVYNKNKVNEPELINYAGLSGQKWFGRLCMTDVYQPENQAIAKMMWIYRGTKLTPEILANWQANMGSPSVSDAAVISKIEQGQCDVGIVDSDVFWGYAKTNPATAVRLMWANQINRGTMTNVITAGLSESGEHVGQALRFIEWLASDDGQAMLAFHTSTFPVVNITDSAINMQAIRPEWTLFEPDSTPLIDIIDNKTKIEPLQPEPESKLLEDKEQIVEAEEISS